MLDIKDLCFSVSDTDGNDAGSLRTIVDRFSFTFEKGKFYAITGPNGRGKTTLAKLIMGIHPATSGRIIFEGRDITELSITDRAKNGISYSFQQPARFKGLTFRDLLAMASGTDDETQLLALIRRVGICSLSFLDKPVDSKLSGGEIKKIELATTIARNPKLAIYDEPDTGIDLWTIGPMVTLLGRERDEHQTTTIVVSHNRAFLEAADIILLLNQGRLSYVGKLEEALPMLTDLSICNYRVCGSEADAQCFR